MNFSHKLAIALSASVLLTGVKSIAQSSEAGIDYNRLDSLLAAGEWQEAHQETRDLMIRAGGAEEDGYLSDENVTNFPCSDLTVV